MVGDSTLVDTLPKKDAEPRKVVLRQMGTKLDMGLVPEYVVKPDIFETLPLGVDRSLGIAVWILNPSLCLQYRTSVQYMA